MKPAVGEVSAGTYAAEAGLEFGDRILKVGDRDATDWETALVSMLDEMLSDGRVPLELEGEDGWVRETTIDVGDDASRLTEPGMLFEGLGFQPWQPPAIVGTVTEDGAAYAGGIEEEDRITAIDGESVVTFGDLQRIVRARPDETVTVELIRGNRQLSREVTLASQEQDGVVTGLLGVGISTMSADYWYVRKFSPIPAIGQAIKRSWTSIGFTVRMLSADGDRRGFYQKYQRTDQYRAVRRQLRGSGHKCILKFPGAGQHQPGCAEPAADTDSRWRTDCVPVHRGPERQPAIGKITNIRAEDRHPGASASNEFRILQRHCTDNRVGTAPC